MQDQEILEKVVQVLTASTLKTSNQLVNHQTVDSLKATLSLNKVALDRQGDQNWDSTLDWVKQYLHYSPNTSHVNFANRMWSGANLPSIVGELVTAFSNTSNCTFESAPVATLMEQYMIGQMLDLVGFKQGEGQMTTGSSNANMIAMMVARNQAPSEAKQQGLFGQQPLFAFVSEDAHYSLDKAANILGLGTEHLIKVPTSDDGRMDVSALEVSIKRIVKEGGKPFFVCATLGTTVRGAYDSLEDLSQLRQKYSFWLHGDGAWGGAAMMSQTLKAKFLSGIEKLDSFTMDFHKMLGSSLMCNFLLLNHQHLLACTCADGDNSYIFRDDESDLGVASLQCGRRVDSLKWFLDWQFYGQYGFADRVENYEQLAKFSEDLVNQSDVLEMVVARSSFNVCFRFKSSQSNQNEFNQALRDRLYQEQKALLSLAYINKKLIFRLLMTNVNITQTTLTDLLNCVIETGRALDHA